MVKLACRLTIAAYSPGLTNMYVLASWKSYPLFMAKVKQAELEAEKEMTLVKVKEEIHAKKSTFTDERVVALGKKHAA